MCAAVLQFFKYGWIIPNYNVSYITLIPKSQDSLSMDMFRPISLCNFKFKIITKIIASMFSSLMPFLVFNEQRGFIIGRNIKDCICLASEAINVLGKKNKYMNITLKVDIYKDFDIIRWEFIINVIKCFGFCPLFYEWIQTILSSEFLSISYNGQSYGYFNCNRGVR